MWDDRRSLYGREHMNISKRLFGKTESGQEVYLWRLENDTGMIAKMLDYGATIRSIIVPDKNGKPTDVVLGYDTLAEYVYNGGCFGGTIGRFANRIGGAEFELNGKSYPLLANNGKNHIHGGKLGFHKRKWQAYEEDNGVTFEIFSPDGDEGYPGNLMLRLHYSWEKNALELCYHAECDQDTIVNFTNHVYFNLVDSDDVNDQLLRIDADAYTPSDETCLPTGEILPVDGTAMDFRAEKPIGQDADSVKFFGGYDTNFVLNPNGEGIQARSKKSGIVLTATTDQPGMQLYTANGMKPRACKNGRIYGHRGGFCLETQHFPDCIHQPDWPSCILHKGESFTSKTTYAFEVETQ